MTKKHFGILCLIVCSFAYGLGAIKAQSIATIWLSPGGTAVSCGAITSINDPGTYMTPAAARAAQCGAAGYTAIWKNGTYGGARVQFTEILPAGTSASVVSTHLCETDRGCIIAFSSVANGTGVINTLNATHYRIGRRGNGFVADCVNGGDGCGGVYLQLSGSIIATNTIVENVLARNHHATAFNMSESQPTNYYDGAKWLYMEAEAAVTPYFTGGGAPHSMYIKGWNVEVAYGTFVANDPPEASQSYAIHGWHNVRHARIHHNFSTVKQHTRGVTMGDDETRPANADNWVYNNVFWCPTQNCSNAISFASNNRNNGARAYNNTIYGFASQVIVGVDNNNSHYVNNVCSGGTCTIFNSGTNLNCGGTCTTTNPTVTAGSHFVNAAAGDFSLISGSSLINAGVNVGFLFNGSAPDRGAFESIPAPTASITSNVLTLTFPANTFLPLTNFSTIGVTVACTPNGDSCPGSPAGATVGRRSGTDTVVDVTISGIASNACLAGQAWTVTYNASTGSWSDSSSVGQTRNQKVFSFTNLPAANACTGSGPPTAPGGLYISYDFNEGTGTAADNTGSFGASGDGTLQNGVTWANGGGVTMTQQSTQHVSIPYGNGVDPTSQSLTIAFTVDVIPGNESQQRSYFGAPLGADKRLQITTSANTWRIGVGTFAGAASDLAVTSGSQHLCLVADATTDTVTLHRNGVASATGAVQTGVASYALAGNFELGRIATLNTGGGGTYRHFRIYNSVEDCTAIYEATLGGGGGAPAGTFSQPAIKFQEVFTTDAGTPVDLRANNLPAQVVANGAVAPVFQVNCDGCESTAFRVAYRKNGVGIWTHVPNSETSDGIFMWGSERPQYINTGEPGSEITGTCTRQTGATLTTAEQTPTVTFPASGCVVLRYLIRIGENAVPGQDYFDLRLETQSGGALATYSNLARIYVVEKQLLH